MHLFELLFKVEEMAEKGVQDNLDPPSVAIFAKAKNDAWVLRRMNKAELQSHVSKGKWG